MIVFDAYLIIHNLMLLQNNFVLLTYFSKTLLAHFLILALFG